jgi:23S rRNA (cytosine1962-C5)-methyltransferase
VFTPDEYELLDFGDGRRLERMGGMVVDRPCPAAADGARTMPECWDGADLRYEQSAGGQGLWTGQAKLSEPWRVRHGTLRFELQPTPLGQVGLFPEQADSWTWLDAQIRRAGRPLRVLNLFAYTGGSTLAAAMAGAEVAHVDSAKPVVAWARRNAAQSDLATAAIRWIVEDAAKFVAREVRRGRRYDALILDPPSYGHGPRGETWKIDRHLDDLLSRCGNVLAERPAFVLLTCHTPSIGAGRLRHALAQCLPVASRQAVRVRTLFLQTATGRRLSSGLAATWPE